MKKAFIYKCVGETPLEAMERWRMTRKDLVGVPLTYAGRLDPMAEGTLLVLIGDECKKKPAYLGLDKEYEVEVVFGITTDTYDALGLAVLGQNTLPKTETVFPLSETWLQKYAGRFSQEYPAYSSKTVGGRQLHELARAGNLPDADEMPTKDVEIYSIEKISEREIGRYDLKKEILGKISLVKGDFRQKEIGERWGEILSNDIVKFEALKIRVKCSSGTYMRSLANRMGKDAGVGAFALSIKRTKILM